jgi:6-phosphogluconate dehydrogenase
MQKELIFIGLGRMGAAMTEHLVEKGYAVHGFDVSTEARTNAASFGVSTYESIAAAINHMDGRKVVWMMVPSQFVDDVLIDVHANLSENDIIIEGGNSFFAHTIKRAAAAQENGVHYIDCGTSGGVDGARHGASLMVGGDKDVVGEIEHIFNTLAITDGYGHVGKSGAGHFVKMAHNGIEYGMMGAIAEGVNFIESEQADLGIDVETALKPYKNGSIISSSLMGWLADSYASKDYLEQIAGEVPKGETEMEMEYIIKQSKTPVLSAALEQRKSTRGNPSRIGTLISAMRNQFGGHKTIKKD